MELNGLYSLDGKLKFMDKDGKFDTEDMYRNQHGAMLYFDDGKWKIAMIEGTPEDQPVPLQPVPLQWLYSRDGRALPKQGTDAKMQKRPGWTDSKGHGPKPGETELTMRGAVARILAWCLNQQPDARPCLGPNGADGLLYILRACSQ